jgi:predicted metal-binding membrane protein
MAMQSLPSFLVTWTAMTAAMMAPSALSFFVAFALRSRRWALPTIVLAAAYLAVWGFFGLAAYFVLGISVPMPNVPRQWTAGVAAGIAIALVGLYSFTPLKRIGQARCIAMCRRQDAIEGLGIRAAVSEGATYGLSCVACSAGVMTALLVVGMSSLVWMVAGSALILLYKIAGSWPRRLDLGLSAALALTGVWLIAV